MPYSSLIEQPLNYAFLSLVGHLRETLSLQLLT